MYKTVVTLLLVKTAWKNGLRLLQAYSPNRCSEDVVISNLGVISRCWHWWF